MFPRSLSSVCEAVGAFGFCLSVSMGGRVSCKMMIIGCGQSIFVGRAHWEAVGSREEEGSDGALSWPLGCHPFSIPCVVLCSWIFPSRPSGRTSPSSLLVVALLLFVSTVFQETFRVSGIMLPNPSIQPFTHEYRVLFSR